jgi:hypothetical protein
MLASIDSKYQQAQQLRETPPSAPGEMEMQALWFEQFYHPLLITDEGETVEIIQPGEWNHGPGPDFIRAALRAPDGKLRVGTVELHLKATDWQAHGHHADPAYDETILHVVWEKTRKPYFPATSEFRRVRQVCLSTQLTAPWETVRPHLASLANAPLPQAHRGLCRQKLAQLPPENLLEILHSAGLFRLKRKSERLHLRAGFLGFKQMLWEAIAEGLGYSQNKIPFRLIAQRLPYARLKAVKKEQRLAWLFGVAGFLPYQSLKDFPPGTKRWIQPLWEVWWKVRPQMDYAVLGKNQWKLAGLRPGNRPERRLAALNQILPALPRLETAIQNKKPDAFARILSAVTDPFWEQHATLTGQPLPSKQALIGDERIHDLLVNIFWPLVFADDPAAARDGLASITAAPNKHAEIARQRLLDALPVQKLNNALTQQGLLQIYHDYCLHDQTDCEQCLFPDLVAKW